MNQRGKPAAKIKLILIATSILLCLVLFYQAGQWLENRNRQPESRSDASLRYQYEPTITVNGADYRKRPHITSILLMGIDRGSQAVSQGYRNNGQADFLRLVVLDGERKTVSQLQIDRDTMTPIVVLSVLGNRSGIRNAQIGLSHGFGDGREQSCELTMEAVSNFLLGSDIDFYMSLDLDGISVLNDQAGGVTVTLEDDFSMLDSAMTKGTTLTLMGDQAETFVRSRMKIGAGTNEARMKRQQQYIGLLLEKLEKKFGGSKTQLQSLLDSMDAYLLASIPQGRLVNELWAAKDYQRLELLIPSGVYSIAPDGFMQFEADQSSLQQIVLDLFYEKLK